MLCSKRKPSTSNHNSEKVRRAVVWQWNGGPALLCSTRATSTKVAFASNRETYALFRVQPCFKARFWRHFCRKDNTNKTQKNQTKRVAARLMGLFIIHLWRDPGEKSLTCIFSQKHKNFKQSINGWIIFTSQMLDKTKEAQENSNELKKKWK